jgi:starch synthase
MHSIKCHGRLIATPSSLRSRSASICRMHLRGNEMQHSSHRCCLAVNQGHLRTCASMQNSSWSVAYHIPAQGSWPPPTVPQGASSPKVATDSAADAQPQQQTQQPQAQQQQHQQQQQEQPPPQQQPAAHSSPPAGENAMNVVLVGAECAPWSKTGDRVSMMGHT